MNAEDKDEESEVYSEKNYDFQSLGSSRSSVSSKYIRKLENRLRIEKLRRIKAELILANKEFSP